MVGMINHGSRGSSLRAQATASGRLNRRGGGGGSAVGRYDYFNPTEKGVWVRFNPRAESDYFVYEVYDSETEEVKTVKTSYLEHLVHWIRPNKASGLIKPRSFNCGAGARLDNPCWGHAYRNDFFAKLRAREKATGVRDSQAKPLVDASPNFAFAMTIMEPVYAVPKIGSDGKVVTSQRTNQPIMNYVPESLMGRQAQKGLGTPEFGRRVHFSANRKGLNQVLDLDDALNGYCLNCAQAMGLSALACLTCETRIELHEPVRGDDLIEALAGTDWQCENCSVIGGARGDNDHEASFMPIFICENGACGNPEPGQLDAFDVKFKVEKSGDEDKSWRYKIAGVRMPKIESEKVADMIAKPLDLKAIFAPTPIAEQAKLLGTLIAGIASPDAKRAKDGEAAAPPAEPYGDNAAEETPEEAVEDDIDGASFG